MSFEEFKKTVVKWQGSWNSDAKCWSGGYLFFRTGPNNLTGYSVKDVKNRSEAIKKYYAEHFTGE